MRRAGSKRIVGSGSSALCPTSHSVPLNRTEAPLTSSGTTERFSESREGVRAMSVESRLRPNCLNFVELLAQNIALISPTMTAALIVPLMFSNTGNVSWLSYAVGTLMLLFVASSLNQFAKRTTDSGSMYSYAMTGLGFGGGAMCGWCLVWAYLFIGLAGTTGFTVFAAKLLDMVHLSVPPVLLFAACIGTSFLIAYKDIKISTLVQLGLEAFSCLLILVLCLIVLGHHPAPDATQFQFGNLSL